MLFIKWSFGQPPSPLNCPRGLWMTPKSDLKNPIPLEEKEGLNSENSILLVLYTNSFRRHFVFDRVIFEPHIYLNSRFFVESCYSYCYKKWFATFSGWEHLMGFNLVEKNLAQNSQMSTCVLCSCLFPRYGVFFSAKKGNLPYGFVTMDLVLQNRYNLK